MQAGGYNYRKKKKNPLHLWCFPLWRSVRAWRINTKKTSITSSAVYQNNGENWPIRLAGCWLENSTAIRYFIHDNNETSGFTFEPCILRETFCCCCKIKFTYKKWNSRYEYREDCKWLAVIEGNLPKRVQLPIDNKGGRGDFDSSIVSYCGAISAYLCLFVAHCVLWLLIWNLNLYTIAQYFRTLESVIKIIWPLKSSF